MICAEQRFLQPEVIQVWAKYPPSLSLIKKTKHCYCSEAHSLEYKFSRSMYVKCIVFKWVYMKLSCTDQSFAFFCFGVCFVLFLAFQSHPAMLKDYSWQCSEDLVVAWNPNLGCLHAKQVPYLLHYRCGPALCMHLFLRNEKSCVISDFTTLIKHFQ